LGVIPNNNIVDVETMDDGELVTIGVFIGMVFVAGLMGFIFFGDNTDQINTREYGERMCSSMGLSYDHRLIVNWDDKGNIPIIYCKNMSITEKPLIDGLVKLNK
jgi:hypothetical protein